MSPCMDQKINHFSSPWPILTSQILPPYLFGVHSSLQIQSMDSYSVWPSKKLWLAWTCEAYIRDINRTHFVSILITNSSNKHSQPLSLTLLLFLSARTPQRSNPSHHHQPPPLCCHIVLLYFIWYFQVHTLSFVIILWGYFEPKTDPV